MNRYAPERKEAILKKLAPPSNLSVAEVAKQEGISQQTLYHWRKQAREQGLLMPNQTDNPENWSDEDKFRVVMETAAMAQAERSVYCRKHGLNPEQVEQWKQICMGGFGKSKNQLKAEKKDANKQRNKIKRLERELNRKDKALAEAAALLTLSKKARAIWEQEDEDE
nr:transposase [Vibrio metschnikovii]